MPLYSPWMSILPDLHPVTSFIFVTIRASFNNRSSQLQWTPSSIILLIIRLLNLDVRFNLRFQNFIVLSYIVCNCMYIYVESQISKKTKTVEEFGNIILSKSICKKLNTVKHINVQRAWLGLACDCRSKGEVKQLSTNCITI
jgi:hypothetical protein